MGTFPGGVMYDPVTGRPVVKQPIQVLAYPTGVPVVPDDGPVTTGIHGGYGRFTVTDHDALTLVAGEVTQDLVSLEKLLASQSGTSGSLTVITASTTIPAGTTEGQLAGYRNSSTSAVTVSGTSLASGEWGVWAWLGGAWTLLNSGASTGGTTDPGDPPPVTPTFPYSDTFTAGDGTPVVGRTTPTGSGIWVTGGPSSYYTNYYFLQPNQTTVQTYVDPVIIGGRATTPAGTRTDGSGGGAVLDVGTPNVKIECDFNVPDVSMHQVRLVVGAGPASASSGMGVSVSYETGSTWGGFQMAASDGTGAYSNRGGRNTSQGTGALTGNLSLEYAAGVATAKFNDTTVGTVSIAGITGTRVGFGIRGGSGATWVDNVAVTSL